MMQMKVEIDVTDRLAEILRAAIVALGSPLVSVAAAPEQADALHPEQADAPPPPPPPPAAAAAAATEGKRGRGRPRKDEQQPAPVEQAATAATEGIDPNELWARAKLVAGSGKEHAQAIRDALAVLGVMRLSAIPPERFAPFGAFLDRLYEGDEIAESLAALTEEISK